jgi:D-alanyl-lipoteichoic acid acyltransferase DltB (MBOAT superfamily)
MVFTSPFFLFVFLPLTWLGYLVSSRKGREGNYWLLIASLVFYAGWDWRFVPLLMASIGLNYLIGERLIARPNRILLIAGLGANLSVIGFWKYADFGLITSNALIGTNFELLALTLPLGISFFTFQQVAYLVDAYRGRAGRSGPFEYALFVAFFPQLIAGPIVHHSEMLAQFRTRPVIGHDVFAHGAFLLVVGLAKKVLIADSLAPWADAGFANPNDLGTIEAWTATLAYTFQLYFDFSGYSEMAMGLALLFGIWLPKNFDSPYKATNIADFWRRWHITLGRFLRDYLYIPLGGNRNGPVRAVMALSITMVLGGLWHGAGWTYVVWGILHGLYLSVHYVWRRIGIGLPDAVGWAVTFAAVVAAWVPFRADSMTDAVAMWSAMIGLNGWGLPPLIAAVLQDMGIQHETTQRVFSGVELPLLLLAIYFVRTQPNVHERWWLWFSPSIKTLALTSAAAMGSIAILGRDSAWIYGAF